ncbi:MAG: amidohydrolase family protein, partial [Candidatus Binatia bacterium]
LRDPAAAREAVRGLARSGADCVKVYRGLSPEVLAAVRSAAAAEGLPVIGHVPDAVSLEGSGISDVQHLTGVPRPPPGGYGTDRVREWVRAWGLLDETRIRAIVTASAGGGVAHTPTLVFWERFFRLAGAEPEGGPARALPRYHRELFWDPTRPWNRTAKDEAALGDALRQMKRVVRRLHESGATIHAGSDALNPFVVPGASLHDELGHLVDSGLSTEAAWAAATRAAAESLGETGLGKIREGAHADFLVFREDPTQTLGALVTLEAVVSRGRLHTVEELERELARYRRHFEDPLYTTLTGAFARLGDALGMTERRL